MEGQVHLNLFEQSERVGEPPEFILVFGAAIYFLVALEDRERDGWQSHSPQGHRPVEPGYAVVKRFKLRQVRPLAGDEGPRLGRERVERDGFLAVCQYALFESAFVSHYISASRNQYASKVFPF